MPDYVAFRKCHDHDPACVYLMLFNYMCDMLTQRNKAS